MKAFLSFAAAAILAASGGWGTAMASAGLELATTCQVETTSGPVHGKIDGATCAFLGIRYVAPPLGELRWKPPRPVQPWLQPLDATEFGPVCPQPSVAGAAPSGPAIGAEDCLRLNIWTPQPPLSQPAPVMVFLHQGRFVINSASLPLLAGRNIAEGSGVVVVTINYRLGALGFLVHRALAAEDPSYPTSGNYGLMDQRAALEWVQGHIAQFGGNPGNVTLFGAAVGGNSTVLHMVSDQSRDLFHRTIIQSASDQRPPALFALNTTADLEPMGDSFARTLGCDPAPDVLACLRSKTPAELVEALPVRSVLLGATPEGVRWQPVIDGVNIRDHPHVLLEEGRFQAVSAIVGSMRDDGYALGASVRSAEQYENAVQAEFGDDALAVLTQYPVSAYSTPVEAASVLMSDARFACPARRLARLTAASGESAFLYSLNHPLSFPEGHPLRGRFPADRATHEGELPFVFQSFHDGYIPTQDDLLVSNAIIGYWTRFATSGNPNGDGAAVWPAYDVGLDQHLKIEVSTQVASVLRPDNCDFWDSRP